MKQLDDIGASQQPSSSSVTLPLFLLQSQLSGAHPCAKATIEILRSLVCTRIFCWLQMHNVYDKLIQSSTIIFWHIKSAMCCATSLIVYCSLLPSSICVCFDFFLSFKLLMLSYCVFNTVIFTWNVSVLNSFYFHLIWLKHTFIAFIRISIYFFQKVCELHLKITNFSFLSWVQLNFKIRMRWCVL